MASQLAVLVAMYSVELNATGACFLLNQDVTPEPELKQEPEVFFLSPALSAQS
jgi:hypothetical protein